VSFCSFSSDRAESVILAASSAERKLMYVETESPIVNNTKMMSAACRAVFSRAAMISLLLRGLQAPVRIARTETALKMGSVPDVTMIRSVREALFHRGFG
jgi:hypothetical protein